MVSSYDRLGVRFLYPDNWTLADDADDQLPRTISVQAPSGAFWSIDIHPFSVDPTELLVAFESAMRAEYPDLESHPAEDSIADESAIGRDMYFLCLDFVIASQVRVLRKGHATYLISCQAEDREFDELRPVFAAIAVSFFRELDEDTAA
jgi:hypothetical protein